MDQKLLDSFFNELNASLEKPDNFKQTGIHINLCSGYCKLISKDVKNPNPPVNFSVAQVGDFGVSEIQSTPSDAVHSFTLLHSPPQTNQLEDIVCISVMYFYLFSRLTNRSPLLFQTLMLIWKILCQ